MLEVVLLIACLVLNHLRAERLLLLGRERVLLLEEGDGDSGVGVCAAARGNEFVARLDHLARVHVVPRSVLAEDVAESPQLEIHLLLGVALLVLQVGHGHVQVRPLARAQAQANALLARAHRADRAFVGAPDGAAGTAGDERVVDSLVGLGLFRGLDGAAALNLGGLGDLDG